MTSSADSFGLGAENTQPTPPVPEPAQPNPLEHGLGTADGHTQHGDEEGIEFGLGADNTQPTPPVPEPAQPDPLRHGLETAEGDTVE